MNGKPIHTRFGDRPGYGYPGKTQRAKSARLKAVAIMNELGHDVEIDCVYAWAETWPEVRARWIAFKIMRGQGLSYAQVTRDTGFTNHTSIMHGIRKIDAADRAGLLA
jgi:hypothetical protein